MAILFSRHARERMLARGISISEVGQAIHKGSKQLQKPDKLLSYYRYFCVVYKKSGDNFFVMTVKPR